MKSVYVLLLFICPFIGLAQSVGIGTTAPNSSAMLDINSTNKGLLIPRLSTVQRTTAIKSPAAGLLVYDTDTKGFWYYNGVAWVQLPTTEGSISTNKIKSIYIAGSGLSYSPSANIALSQYGLNLANNAGQVVCIVPKPVDWDSTLPFTVTLHFSLPSNTTNTFIAWRLSPGGMRVNLPSGSANTGWDSYNYYTTEDASLLVSYANSSYSNLSKTQSWTTKWSSTYNTWYFGATNSVTVANSFSDNPLWRFGFQRGTAVSNGETYSGNMTVNAVTITYTAK